MQFGLMFFSTIDPGAGRGKYRLLLEAARYADTHGFACVWLPERHFHPFGGLFPNPAVAAAAVAQVTSRIELRAGSLVSPLHDPLRIVEEWSMVDNLSDGRVAMSFGSGWNPNDFVFFPERYSTRRELMFEQIETVLQLWSGGCVPRRNPFGEAIDVQVFPRPLQARPALWVTAGGRRATFEAAGRLGANVLTSVERSLLGRAAVSGLPEHVQAYRRARACHGFDPAEGKVAVMLHTLLGTSLPRLRERAGGALRSYLRAAMALELQAERGAPPAAAGDGAEVSAADLEALIDVAFERYFEEASLIGTVEQRLSLVRQLEEIGVDEIACLVDFVDSPELILDGLPHLDRLRRLASAPRTTSPAPDAPPAHATPA